MSANDEPWMVWSIEQSAWWGPNSAGYTKDVRQAGLYTKEDALSICREARMGWTYYDEPPTEIAVPVTIVPDHLAVREARDA